MKFIIDYVSKNSGRVGNLIQQRIDKKFQTPLLIQITKGGSVPYLARDVFDHVLNEPQLIQLSLATMIHMNEGLAHFQKYQKGGVAAYVGFHDYPTVLMIRDPCEEMLQGFNEKNTVPLFTRHGKRLLSAEKYMDLVEIFKPDFYQGLNDADTNVGSTKKRLRKSHDRTEEFMDYCYERHEQHQKIFGNHSLLVPIAGGYCTFTRSLSIKHAITKMATAPNIVGGYLYEGFHNYGLTATKITVKDQMLPVMKHCISEMVEVQRTNAKPIILPGAYTPIMMLELIRLGVDIFDTSYAYLASINFKALAYSFELGEKQQTQQQLQKNTPTAFIDVTDVNYKDDFTPLLSNCKCLACKNHTRGYIHHLYVTSELLGPILLMIHNLHHMLEFFNTIRSVILQDRLEELIHLIKYQQSVQEIDYSIKKHEKLNTKLDINERVKS